MPLAGHGLRPPPLRRRASRPQLKRDPLDGAKSMAWFSRSWDRFSRVERVFVASLALWATLFVVANAFGVEFESWRVQRVGSLLFWLSPLILLVLAAQVRKGRWRIAATLSTGLLVIVSLLPAGCAALEVTDVSRDKDFGFEPVWRQQRATSELVLYRTNCGAPCSFGLVLRQERRIVPGVRAFRRLDGWYPADSATVSPISSNTLRIEISPYGYKRPNPIIDTVTIRTSFLWP